MLDSAAFILLDFASRFKISCPARVIVVAYTAGGSRAAAWPADISGVDVVRIDYNVQDDWPDDEPRSTKCLISSLDRVHGSTSALPLTTCVQEIIDWIKFGNSAAWGKAANRDSLRDDLEQAIRALGKNTTGAVGSSISNLSVALDSLLASHRSTFTLSPGMRTTQVWTDVVSAAHLLLDDLVTNAAVRAAWEDIKILSETGPQDHRRSRPLIDLLHDQMRLRDRNADGVIDNLVSCMGTPRLPGGLEFRLRTLSLRARNRLADRILMTTPVVGRVVVWIGYIDAHIDDVIAAGGLALMDASWAVLTLEQQGEVFPHSAELAKVHDAGMFKVAHRVGEESAVHLLVRVDLGTTSVHNASKRAESCVETLLGTVVHWSGGVRPLPVQFATLLDGVIYAQHWQAARLTLADDPYGKGLTANALSQHAPRLGAALVDGKLPKYLVAALDAQTAADFPFDRAHALPVPADSHLRNLIPLADRVVENVAAYASMDPDVLVQLLLLQYPFLRWLDDVENAIRICLLGGGPHAKRVDHLSSIYHGCGPVYPWIMFATDYASDLLDVCRVESERDFVSAMLRSLTKPNDYLQLHEQYGQEGVVLNLRRRRARNALVHGNPVSVPVIGSLTSFSRFLSNTALWLGIESFVSGSELERLQADQCREMRDLLDGVAAIDVWRQKAAHPTG